MMPGVAIRAAAAAAALMLAGSGAAASATPVPPPTRGGTLTVAIGGNWDTMDPARYTRASERQILYSIYSPLLARDPAFAITPGLVKSWTVSPDGTRVTLQLQRGVRFQDGTPFDAAAVKFNIDRILNPANGSAFRAGLASIKAVRVVSPSAVALDLTGPFTPLLAWFTDGPGFISSPTAVRKWGAQYGLHPVGTGPFSFVEWVTNDHLAVKRFAGYWEHGLPYLDGLVYRPIPDVTVQVEDLRAGVVNVIDTVPADQQHAIGADNRFRTLSLAGARWPVLRLNNAIPPFNNKALRQAISYALNRDQIVTTVYSGQARPAYGPISPVYQQYFDPTISRWGIGTNLDAGPREARRGRTAAGVHRHARDLHVPGRRPAGAVGQDPSGGGRDHRHRADRRPSDAAERIAAKRYQALIGSWTLRPDIDGTMYNYFSSQGTVNSVAYSNPIVDALFEETRVVPDGPARVQLYRQLQHQLVDDAPWAFLVVRKPHGRHGPADPWRARDPRYDDAVPGGLDAALASARPRGSPRRPRSAGGYARGSAGASPQRSIALRMTSAARGSRDTWSA